jgi:hypothetical protein
MDHADASADQVAKTVFWIMFLMSLGFIIGAVILTR